MMLEMVLASYNFCIASCRTTSAKKSEGDGHEPDGPGLSSNNNELVETVKKIGALMTVCTHALNNGDVYIKAPGAAMTYIKMMDVEVT